MAHYNVTLPSSHSQELVFQYLANFSSVQEWDPSVLEAKSLNEPYCVGAKFLVVVRFLGRETPFEYETIEYEEGQRIVLRAQSKTVTSLDTITVNAQPDGGSTVTYDALLDLRGVFQVFNPILQLLFQKLGDNAKTGLSEKINQKTLGLSE